MSGTILVVEDEPGVRDVAVQMLKFSGLKVLEAIEANNIQPTSGNRFGLYRRHYAWRNQQH